MFQFYRPFSPFNVPMNEHPAKFAITGSQNTSVPVALAQRKLPEARAESAPTSKATGLLDDDDPFILPW
jgi:hypothetical protein